MPVSHIGLTVSHLPASSSFFLSALQPLGYRYLGQQGHQVAFGIREADFFLSQETPGIKAGAAHIAFTATSRTAVRDFYSAALNAGARPNGSPACRTDDDSHFNAAVLDLDGNSIEVVYSGAPDYRDDGTVISHSRVITWERTVTQSMRDDASVVSSRTARSVARALTEAPSVASKAPSIVSQAPSVARSISEPVSVPQAAPPAASGSGDATKTLVGTLLGAAAGAAVAYAFVRSERDSAKKEADFSAFMEAKNTVKAAVGLAQASPPSQPPMHDPPPSSEPAPSVARSVHRNDDAGSVVSATPSRASQMPIVRGQKQIEAAPASYYAPPPSHVSLSRSNTAEPLQIEYAPARSVAGSDMRSRFSASRSMTSPEIRTIEAARSVASVSTAQPEGRSHSRAQSVAHSTAPSSFISSFVPDNVSRKPEGSVYSHHSSRSKAKSSHSHASRHSSHTRHRSKEDRSPSPSPSFSEAPTKKPSRAASVISSIFGRDKKSSADSDFIDDLDIDELTEDDYETVVPSDSISQAGSSRRSHRRKHRSRTDELRDEAGTTVSKSSSRSHRSHRSHRSRHDDDSDSDHSTESRRRHRSSRSTTFSEPSDASTVRPTKHSSSSRDKERRKDSLTEGSKYDDLFDQVQYGHGSVPVRGITPSMINASTNGRNRSVLSFETGQKIKACER